MRGIMLPALVIGMGLLGGCGSTGKYEYRVEVVSLPELYLRSYYELTAADPARVDNESQDRQVEEMMAALEDDPQLAETLQQKTSVQTTLMLNRAGARGWQLVHMNVDGNYLHWTFRRAGYGPLVEQDLKDRPGATALPRPGAITDGTDDETAGSSRVAGGRSNRVVN
jgi:hypothetical protein